jgi:hypothetical protein
MSIEPISRIRRAAHIAYSQGRIARLYRAWRRFADDPSRQSDIGRADILLLPLIGLALTLLLLGTVPSASDMIADACSIACMP